MKEAHKLFIIITLVAIVIGAFFGIADFMHNLHNGMHRVP